MWKNYWFIVIAVLALDQSSKYLVRDTMALHESIEVLPFLSFTYIENKGAAFGILHGQTWPLILITCFALILIWYLYAKQDEKLPSFIWATSLISAGAIGNLIDRIYKQSVTDMFDLHFWPIFNVADISIIIGCALLGYYFIKYSEI